MVELKENERVDDLLLSDFKIIQNTDGFMYGTDAVLLASFSKINRNSKVLDLCSGSGIIPILMYLKFQPKEIVGIEYFPHLTDMSIRSLKLNNIEDKIKFITGDVKDYKNIINHGYFDYITCNPPYMINDTGLHNANDFKTCARHEILCDLNDCVKAASYGLKYGGRLSMVHRSSRLSDIIYAYKINGIEPKKITFVMTNVNSKPKLVLIEGIKGGKPDVVITNPIILYKNENEFSEKVKGDFYELR